MTFSAFKKSISKIEKIALPGEKSHEEMAPLQRLRELKETDIQERNPKEAAVMVLFYPNVKGETMLVLILRKTYKGVHSAQIGFPGGRVEKTDKNLMHTALRETQEEIGADPKKIHVWRQLTRLYIPPSNFWVTPFIGTLEETPYFVPQDAEVEAIVEVALEDFLNDANLTEKILTTSYATNIKVPAFLFNGQVVWGATGMMLNEVKAMLKTVL